MHKLYNVDNCVSVALSQVVRVLCLVHVQYVCRCMCMGVVSPYSLYKEI